MQDEQRAKALREGALAALRELALGFEEANARADGALLGEGAGDIHAGLVAAILRTFALRLAEGRGEAGDSISAVLRDLAADRAALGRGAFEGRRGAWARVLGLFRGLDPEGLAEPGSLLDGRAHPFLAAADVADGAVLRALERLLSIAPEGGLAVEDLGSVYEGLLGVRVEAVRGERLALAIEPVLARRRLGAHYTARSITRVMVERTLAPLLPEDASPEAVLALRVCDPAMGSGAFLVEACRMLAERLMRAWARAGGAPEGADGAAAARRLVARSCIHGVDRDRIAVDLARIALWLEAAAPEPLATFGRASLRHGDALVGLPFAQMASVGVTPRQTTPPEASALADAAVGVLLREKDKKARARAFGALTNRAAEGIEPLAAESAEVRRAFHPFHWDLELPEIFAPERGGFDAFLGNPPWVSYAGRASQPLAKELRAFYTQTSPAFAGYRNLQGIFVHRCASLLRPGGRLGLVLPTSMSDLGGYAATRRAHDALCVCDDELPDFGDVFDGVFQPSMGLLSTRRKEPVVMAQAGAWPLARSDLDTQTRGILEALGARPKLPPHLFGERGFQSMGDDVQKLRALPAPEGAFTAGVRVGGDIEPFLRKSPGLHCDPAAFGGRFRPEAEWKAVRFLIRQTARYPMAALSDGLAFRNSILAGFEDETWSAFFLVAYLNASPVRWFHYVQHRDARQGMPQMKITHLRALPAPEAGSSEVKALEALGREIGLRNEGIRAEEQEEIDRLAGEALGLAEGARERIRAWRGTVKG
ncbi:Eco57I restriction-modification methylase domain-containing protein [Polyangium aurulentum]|uniref:Eco57I restriction-modification methylase domain-containing protein n=1 Tax=Polyangium aurulentum TaxID=2567896 RepID=UPI0010ADF616|nr:N-6 DNA methylase [Polyangium aurulentum]UQA54829.1 N-6 DNA methylase [Polyangium aurulentum]